jgi:amidase
LSTFKEYDQYDAIGLAGLIKKREVTPLELLEEAISRIEKANPVLNAVVTKLYDEAKKEIDSGLPVGPFSGVPFLLKEFEQYAGSPITNSSRFFVNNICNQDSEIVKRYKKGGLVILGKTNTSELCITASTESSLYGPCRNPWNTEISTGGSSGGAAAAVAAGIVPVAQGSDGGGSIRIPASCCGVFGMKPTRGRNPWGPVYGESWSGLHVKHVLSRSVRDSAAFLDLTCGPDVGAPYYLTEPTNSFLSQLNKELKPLKVGYTTSSVFEVEVDQECIIAVEKTVGLLKVLGHEIEEIELDYIEDAHEFWKAFYTVMMANTDAEICAYSKRTGQDINQDKFENFTWLNLQRSKNNTATDFVAAQQYLHRIGRKIAKIFESYDVIVTPVIAKPPPPIGYLNTEGDFDEYSKKAGEYFLFTGCFNVSGNPAMSMPLHSSSDNLPIGVQFVGKYADEETLYRLAYTIEKERLWLDRYSFEYC